jgi:hypothetical protein
MWGLWWITQHWGRLYSCTSVSSANHSTNFSIIIITRGWHNRPIGGRSAEWTQLDSTRHYTNKKTNTGAKPVQGSCKKFQEKDSWRKEPLKGRNLE